MVVIYNIFIYMYLMVALLLSPFNRKAALWYNGRKGFFRKWEGFNSGGRKVIWFHCASLGEFEQCRPVIEEIRKLENNIFVLLTFFSPSGYEVRKDHPLADAVCYLPADTRSNSERFISTFSPSMAVFVKYEFWYNYLNALTGKRIPVYLISANFREDQIFFRWYGKWFCRMLHMFTRIFVQSESSLQLLSSVKVMDVTVAGDTRFDRVHSLSLSRREIPPVAVLSQGKFTIVAGSTWPPDHDLIIRFINETALDVNFIIAPHEIVDAEIDRLEAGIEKRAVRYSRAGNSESGKASVLIIDNIGLLSSLYSYGKLAYIGGGFGKNVHNILEACTYGLPVIFGPKHTNFREARELSVLQGAFPVYNYSEFRQTIEELAGFPDKLSRAGLTAKIYVQENTGASRIIAGSILNSVQI
jgi:3-deoxy-D-manno-octulosonic-acid transferase